MRKINPNLLKLAGLTYNPDLATPSLEEKVEDAPLVNEPEEIRGFVYVPSIKIYVAEERSMQGKNWHDCHKELHKQGLKMPTLHEFVEFLKYLKENPDKRNKKILEDITAVREPWRGEWLDADFKVIKGKLCMHYRHETINNKLKPKHTDELKDYLAEDKTPGIDFDYWLKNATALGLPPKDCRNGTLYYWAPMSDNNSVARFYAVSGGAGLGCGRDPSYSDASLGVFACVAGDGTQNF